MMINPSALHVHQYRYSDRARGTKFYRAGFDMPGYARVSRKPFKTATAALDYGARLLARWERLYQAAILAQAAAPQVPS